MKIYLAGPDVFLPNPIEAGNYKKVLCEKYGFTGVFPMDNEISSGHKTLRDVGLAIYQGDVALMDRCDCIIANMTPYNGVSCDIGTGFEIGYMRGKQKPIFAYSNINQDFLTRQKSMFSHYVDSQNVYRDMDTDMAFVNFNCVDNPMLDGAVADTHNGVVFTPQTNADNTHKTHTRLDVFEQVLQHMHTLYNK